MKNYEYTSLGRLSTGVYAWRDHEGDIWLTGSPLNPDHTDATAIFITTVAYGNGVEDFIAALRRAVVPKVDPVAALVAAARAAVDEFESPGFEMDAAIMAALGQALLDYDDALDDGDEE